MLCLDIYCFLIQYGIHILKRLLQIFLTYNFEPLTLHASTAVLYVTETVDINKQN